MTRSLARTQLSLSVYAARFGSELENDFAEPLAACVERELIVVEGDRLRLTPEGMFFADAVLGTFAHDRVEGQLKPKRERRNEAAPHHMG